MSVWLTIPSKRPPEEAEKVLKLWRERGYKIALFRDSGDGFPRGVDYCASGQYGGYARIVNDLIDGVMHENSDAEWFIAAGDDVEPDLNLSADDIAQQCGEYFTVMNAGGRFAQAVGLGGDGPQCPPMKTTDVHTFGVMQPTGDRWGDAQGAYIDRVCGSAWIGREFARRVNNGRGPLWPEYYHMFVDEHLQCVAQKLGVFWQRPDLIQLHDHWGRGPQNSPNQLQSAEKMPGFLKRANSREEWDRAKQIFQKHKEAGFAESLILAP